MAAIYLQKENTPFCFNTESGKVYLMRGDTWEEICDPEIRRRIRLQSSEITREAAMKLVEGLQPPGTRPPADSC